MASDPILDKPISNGHAARMRYARFRSLMLGIEPKSRGPQKKSTKRKRDEQEKQDETDRQTEEQAEVKKESASESKSIKLESSGQPASRQRPAAIVKEESPRKATASAESRQAAQAATSAAPTAAPSAAPTPNPLFGASNMPESTVISLQGTPRLPTPYSDFDFASPRGIPTTTAGSPAESDLTSVHYGIPQIDPNTTAHHHHLLHQDMHRGGGCLAQHHHHSAASASPVTPQIHDPWHPTPSDAVTGPLFHTQAVHPFDMQNPYTMAHVAVQQQQPELHHHEQQHHEQQNQHIIGHHGPGLSDSSGRFAMSGLTPDGHCHQVQQNRQQEHQLPSVAPIGVESGALLGGVCGIADGSHVQAASPQVVVKQEDWENSYV